MREKVTDLFTFSNFIIGKLIPAFSAERSYFGLFF